MRCAAALRRAGVSGTGRSHLLDLRMSSELMMQPSAMASEMPIAARSGISACYWSKDITIGSC
jgi:hypothetical protein